MFNIPRTFTQGDRLNWQEQIKGFNPSTDQLTCYLRGKSVLDLNGTINLPGDRWDFTISSAMSQNLLPGSYKAQFVIIQVAHREALGIVDLVVCPNFEGMFETDFTSDDEKELTAITKAIASLASGAVSEYRIGDRMMRYQDLAQLTNRQRELRNRISKTQNRGSIGGRNVGIRFTGSDKL